MKIYPQLYQMKTGNLSTHEKQLLEQRARIEEVEKENLGAKSWTMQGEVQNLIQLLSSLVTCSSSHCTSLVYLCLLCQVNASKRPKNSALEVDLDWERNAKPPPVITEEVSQSIEELILKRISEVSLTFYIFLFPIIYGVKCLEAQLCLQICVQSSMLQKEHKCFEYICT